MMRFKIHITTILALVLFCLFLGENLQGQGDNATNDRVELIKFDKEAWEKAKEGINYSKDRKEREEKNKEDQNASTDRNRNFDGPDFNGLNLQFERDARAMCSWETLLNCIFQILLRDGDA